MQTSAIRNFSAMLTITLLLVLLSTMTASEASNFDTDQNGDEASMLRGSNRGATNIQREQKQRHLLPDKLEAYFKCYAKCWEQYQKDKKKDSETAQANLVACDNMCKGTTGAGVFEDPPMVEPSDHFGW